MSVPKILVSIKQKNLAEVTAMLLSSDKMNRNAK
jgi:hypothetical protein